MALSQPAMRDESPQRNLLRASGLFWNLGTFFTAATYSGDSFPVTFNVKVTARSKSRQRTVSIDSGGRCGGSNRSSTHASTDKALGGSDGGCIELLAAVKTATANRRMIAMDFGLTAIVDYKLRWWWKKKLKNLCRELIYIGGWMITILSRWIC